MSESSNDNTPVITGRTPRADRVFRGLAIGAGLIVLVVLGLIAVTMISRTTPAFRHMGFRFFTERRWAPPKEIYGALALIWGTLFTSVVALTIAVPVSIGIALFVTQVAPDRLRRPIVTLLDLLAVIPSVVFGMWGVLVLARHIKGFYKWLHTTFHSWPVLGTLFGRPQTRSFLTAGIILAVMVTPIISGDYIYGVCSYGELRCLLADTGERIWEDTTAVPKARWANIHFVRHNDEYWLFNERGELIIARLAKDGYHEISRAKLIAPTTEQLRQRGGVCWSHPAFANRCVFARNDEELVCGNLAASK